MNQSQLQFYVPMISMIVGPLMTLVVILWGVFFNSRQVDNRIADAVGRLEAVMKAEAATLRVEMLQQFAQVRQDIAELEKPVERLEEPRVVR